MWVLGTLAKRWTAALQPKGFDSPVLLVSRPTKTEIAAMASSLGYLDFGHGEG